jgi:hypothetical protein
MLKWDILINDCTLDTDLDAHRSLQLNVHLQYSPASIPPSCSIELREGSLGAQSLKAPLDEYPDAADYVNGQQHLVEGQAADASSFNFNARGVKICLEIMEPARP